MTNRAKMPRARSEPILGVLLAGGQSRRMGGGDKCLQMLDGETLLTRAIARAQQQVDMLILNANGNPARFATYALPVVPYVIDGHAGPLAGVLSGMEWARENRPDCPLIATFATDAPFFPRDLVRRLLAARECAHAPLACAVSGGRTHPVFGIWPVDLADDLRRAMTAEDIRKVDRWTARHGIAHAVFDDTPKDPFFNINRPEELTQARTIAVQIDK